MVKYYIVPNQIYEYVYGDEISKHAIATTNNLKSARAKAIQIIKKNRSVNGCLAIGNNKHQVGEVYQKYNSDKWFWTPHNEYTHQGSYEYLIDSKGTLLTKYSLNEDGKVISYEVLKNEKTIRRK